MDITPHERSVGLFCWRLGLRRPADLAGDLAQISTEIEQRAWSADRLTHPLSIDLRRPAAITLGERGVHARSRLKLAADDVRTDGFMSLLQKADRSFAPVRPAGYSGINKDGFLVDLIKPTPSPPWKNEATRLAPTDPLVASEIPSLKWLLASPKFEATVIGIDGMPATMVTPDPRAFAIHKWWLSQQADRDPLKKPRDRAQAIAVARLVEGQLQHLAWADMTAKTFPAEMQPLIDELKSVALTRQVEEEESFAPRQG